MPRHRFLPDDDLFAPPSANEWAIAFGLALVLGAGVFAAVSLAMS